MAAFEVWTVQQIEEYLKTRSTSETDIENLLQDTRVSVQKLGRREQKRLFRQQQEQVRLTRLYQYEAGYYDQGLVKVAGLDEAGRGPWAGPVVTAAVILPPFCLIEGLNDSKQVQPHKREQLFEEIIQKAEAYTWEIRSAEEIDRINIYQATLAGMRSCITKLQPQALLLDAVELRDLSYPQTSLIKGDSLSASIAAASILAKVIRDGLMAEYDKVYPDYGFIHHKGYGTAEHLAALNKHGFCPIHRKSFNPIKSML